jgi:hypothetical protein
MLRGQAKVSLEWTLVTTSYNLKRLFNGTSRVSDACFGLRPLSAKDCSDFFAPDM